jgi:hypothetical protein
VTVAVDHVLVNQLSEIHSLKHWEDMASYRFRFEIKSYSKITHYFLFHIPILGGDDRFGSFYQKIYYYPRYVNVTWIEAKMLCKTYNLQLATIQTLNEAYAVMNMINRNADLGVRDNLWVYIDGMGLTPRTSTDWYWSESGNKIDFTMPWLTGQPDTAGGAEWFLSIGKYTKDTQIGFNDIPGTGFVNAFLCQKYI